MSEAMQKHWFYRHQRLWTLLIVAVLVLLSWLFYSIYADFYLYEDDAYIESHVISISSVVSGQITETYINDLQRVNKDQKLFTIDPTPFEDALQESQAALLSAERDKKMLLANIQQQQAVVDQAKLTVDHNLQEWQRIEPLMQTGAVSKDQGEKTFFILQSSRQMLNQAQSELSQLNAKLGDPNKPYPPVAKAKAAISKAQYELDHTVVKAPSSGYISNYLLRSGEYVTAGNPLFALIDNGRWWVLARIKESNLPRVKEGAKADIWLDILPGQCLQGKVLGAAWGVNRRQASNEVRPSVLPFLKQEEHWIQLDQRFPVRILIESDTKNLPLRVGASAKLLIKSKA